MQATVAIFSSVNIFHFLATMNSPISSIDFQSLSNSTNGDFRLIQRLVAIVDDYYPEQIEQINESISQQDISAVQEKTRNLEGVLRDIGANQAAKTANDLVLSAEQNQLQSTLAHADNLELEILEALQDIRSICEKNTSANIS